MLSQAREKKRAERAARDAADGIDRGFGTTGTDGASRPEEWEPSYRVRTAPTFRQPGLGPNEDPQPEYFDDSLDDEEGGEYLEEAEESDDMYFDDDGEQVEQIHEETAGTQHQQQLVRCPEQKEGTGAAPESQNRFNAMTASAATTDAAAEAMLFDGEDHQITSDTLQVAATHASEQLAEEDYVGVVGTIYVLRCISQCYRPLSRLSCLSYVRELRPDFWMRMRCRMGDV